MSRVTAAERLPAGDDRSIGAWAAAPPVRRPDLLRRLQALAGDRITHIEPMPAREGRFGEWPAWVPTPLREALAARGVARPWLHQQQTAEAAHDGRHVVVATGTASGKSLGYQLPVLAALLGDPRAAAIYLAPTKALTVDQYESVDSLGLAGVRPAVFDGDTPLDERDWVRAHARLVLTNPDMLHRGILPGHERWPRLFRGLRYVVVDECHAYRGVFGSHVALVIRRLRRVARLYGSDPVFVLASATVSDPAGAASRLIGAEVVAVTEDCSPTSGADFLLWEPGPLSGRAAEAAREAGSGAEPPVHRPAAVLANGACREPAASPDPAASPAPAASPDSAASLVWAGQPAADTPEAAGIGARRSAPAEAADLLAELVAAGARTLAFVRSRHSAEQTAVAARRALLDLAPDLVDRVDSYRGGYLPEDRRALERALGSGELLGVASTNALELGIDIAGLDAAVLAGYPGSIASIWQQAGRAGRGRRRALVVFIAREDPLDTYLVHHPEAIFGRAVEATMTDPTNRYLLAGHLRCAAAEHRLDETDVELFGGTAVVGPVLEQLTAARSLRRRPNGWYWVDLAHPANEVDLRGAGRQVAIVEADCGRILGTVDEGRAPAAVHPGAVHLHRGQSFSVLDLDLDQGVAYVKADRPGWTTVARSTSEVELCAGQNTRLLAGGVTIGVGPVRVTEQVVGYLRRRPSGEILDSVSLDMPEHQLLTKAVWYTIPADALRSAGLADAQIPGALHAAEHAAIGLLPLFAGCDRSDIGGLSTMCHPDTGEPTVIVYDGFAGGAGFADRGHAVLVDWLQAVRDAVAGCPCAAGCPSCVQSPKCGNGNHPLFKAGAVTVLQIAVTALRATPSVAATGSAG